MRYGLRMNPKNFVSKENVLSSKKKKKKKKVKLKGINYMQKLTINGHFFLFYPYIFVSLWHNC